VHGRLPYFLPLGGRLLSVTDGPVATLEHHAMLLLVERVQSAVGNAHVAVLDLPVPLSFHLILVLLFAFELVIGHPMKNALRLSGPHHVQDALVYQSVPFVLLIGFEDAEVIVGLAFVDGGNPLVDSMVVRVFGSAQFGQHIVLDVVTRRRDEVGEPARMVGWLMRWLVRQILIHFDEEAETMRKKASRCR